MSLEPVEREAVLNIRAKDGSGIAVLDYSISYKNGKPDSHRVEFESHSEDLVEPGVVRPEHSEGVSCMLPLLEILENYIGMSTSAKLDAQGVVEPEHLHGVLNILADGTWIGTLTYNLEYLNGKSSSTARLDLLSEDSEEHGVVKEDYFENGKYIESILFSTDYPGLDDLAGGNRYVLATEAVLTRECGVPKTDARRRALELVVIGGKFTVSDADYSLHDNIKMALLEDGVDPLVSVVLGEYLK